MTHFASETPALHVAAHEAAHQIQHAGLTNDAGLGAEGHAGAIADAVAANRPVAGLIGTSGERVGSARRNYTNADRQGKWKGVSPGAVFAKLSDTGETFTLGGQKAYATPALISQANELLKAKQSGIALSAGGGGMTVEAPDGSGTKSLSAVKVDIEASPVEKTMPGDCREAALEVMGRKDAKEEAAAVSSQGGQQTTVPGSPTDMVAMTIFIDRRIQQTRDYNSLDDNAKRRVIEQAKEDYAKLSDEQKQEIKKSPLAEERAKQLGIDAYAAPGVGEAFAAIRGTKAGLNEFHFHMATVIMVTGSDRVTLENQGGDPGRRDKKWTMDTYGPASKKQSFHQSWAREGEGWHTLVVRTGPPPPNYVSQLQQMSTYELFVRHQASTNPDEKSWLEQEIKKRSMQIDVQVDETEDTFGSDDVYALVSNGGGLGVSTGSRAFRKGTGHTFMIPLSRLWPLSDRLSIHVYEWDLIDPDDLIGTINWAAPYHPKGEVAMSYRNAMYRVTVAMFGGTSTASPHK